MDFISPFSTKNLAGLLGVNLLTLSPTFSSIEPLPQTTSCLCFKFIEIFLFESLEIFCPFSQFMIPIQTFCFGIIKASSAEPMTSLALVSFEEMLVVSFSSAELCVPAF